MVTIIVDTLKEKEDVLKLSKCLSEFQIETRGVPPGSIIASHGTEEESIIIENGTYMLDLADCDMFEYITDLHNHPETVIVNVCDKPECKCNCKKENA